MLKKELEKIVGGLSKPSKMPGPAYNLPAYKCITGQKLAKVPGSVCFGCYALKDVTGSTMLSQQWNEGLKLFNILAGLMQ